VGHDDEFVHVEETGAPLGQLRWVRHHLAAQGPVRAGVASWGLGGVDVGGHGGRHCGRHRGRDAKRGGRGRRRRVELREAMVGSGGGAVEARVGVGCEAKGEMFQVELVALRLKPEVWRHGSGEVVLREGRGRRRWLVHLVRCCFTGRRSGAWWCR